MKIPQIRRPWNPAYQKTFDAMSPKEKRISWLIDAAVVVVCLLLIAWSAQ